MLSLGIYLRGSILPILGGLGDVYKRQVDVVLAFEDEFDIEIADEDVDSVNTVGDCVSLIARTKG